MRPDAASARRRREWAVVAGVVAGLLLLLYLLAVQAGGVAVGPYLLGTVVLLALIYALLALGLSLEYGFTGLVNFGHVLFAGVGAYGYVLLAVRGWPLAAALLAGLVLAVLVALLLGLPTLRLREDYLAIVTIGAAEILRRVAENEEWLTRGVIGYTSFPRPLLEWSLENDAWKAVASWLDVRPFQLVLLTLALAGVVVGYAVVERLVRSPWGRVLRAIREDEDVARALGKNVFAYKLQSLAIGSALAAFGGILFVWNTATLYPSHFPHLTTFFVWVAVVLGGVANHRGALVGAALLWGVFELAGHLTILRELGLRDLTGPPQAIAIGLLLIATVLFRPQGLLGRREEHAFVR